MKVRDLEWWIIGFLGLGAFALSISGYSVLFDAEGIQRNTLDLLYQSVKIFGMDFIDDFSSPLPWQLETARWLAPALVIYTAIKAIMFLIRREIKSAFIKYYHNHIIVVGLNERSRRLTSDLLSHGEKVVAVGDIADERKLDPLEREGALIVEGELTGKNFLRNIGAARARYFVFLDDEDEKNIENAIVVYNYLQDHNRGRGQMLYTHVSDDLKLIEIAGLRIFDGQKFARADGKNCEIRIFSAYERASRIIFNNYSPDSFVAIKSPDDPPVRIAVLGSGCLAQSFVLRIARLAHFANLRKTRITWFQEHKHILDRIELNFKSLRNFVDIDLIDTPPELFDGENFALLHSEEPFAAVYVLCDDDTVASGILNKLSRIDINGKINVIVAVKNPDSLLSRRVDGLDFDNVVLHKCSAMEETFTRDGLISETLDKLAKVVHNDYLSKLETVDSGRSSHRPWERLPHDFKNQNREQADHLLVKLRALGYDPEVNKTSLVIPPEKVELLAQMEHKRWWAFLALNGWVRSEKRDDRNKRHTDLKPYEELSEETRQYDRNAVLNIPAIMKKYV
ncbi:MAG: RyR domain-containing protein [Bacteroidales bacterium]|jgi:hypothetical protein|nr:RyR domain-containing protein [Bacteroidales bacterium]